MSERVTCATEGCGADYEATGRRGRFSGRGGMTIFQEIKKGFTSCESGGNVHDWDVHYEYDPIARTLGTPWGDRATCKICGKRSIVNGPDR